jgi:SAM-dependent methyltransferase
MALRNLLARPFRASAGMNRTVVLDLLRPLSGRILELGPGAAPLLENLPHIVIENKWVIEFPGAMDYCRAKGYRCLEQDLGRESWNVDDQSVDVVVSSQCLEHIPNTDHVMQETWRVLKPGGHVLVSVPNQTALVYVIMMLATLNPPMNMVSDLYYGLGNPLSTSRFKHSAEFGTEGHGHLRLFAMRAMLDLLKVYGFEVIRKHGVTWGLPLVGKWLARAWPYYGLFTVVLARKPQNTVTNA